MTLLLYVRQAVQSLKITGHRRNSPLRPGRYVHDEVELNVPVDPLGRVRLRFDFLSYGERIHSFKTNNSVFFKKI
jgi:hypothetical protein